MTNKLNVALLTMIVALFATTGCTVSGDLDEEFKNKNVICTDIRDGEKFEYNTNTIRDIRVDPISHYVKMTLTDSTGKVRTMDTPMEQWIKCVDKE